MVVVGLVKCLQGGECRGHALHGVVREKDMSLLLLVLGKAYIRYQFDA